MYEARGGETFEDVALRVYGSAENARLLAATNPGLSEPLTAGDQVQTAPVFSVPTAQSDTNPLETVVYIGTHRVRQWSSVTTVESIDQVSSVEIAAVFDPNDPEHREAFRPFSYAPVVVQVGQAQVFTGYLAGVVPELTAVGGSVVTLQAYAAPGVMDECTLPASAFPHEFNGLDLRRIAQAVADVFGVPLVFQGEPGPAFEKVALTQDKAALSFLADLAKQRGKLITSDTQGRLVITDPPTVSPPVAVLEQGRLPLVEVLPFFNNRDYFSHITGVEPVKTGSKGAKYTVENPHLKQPLRPHNFRVQDAEGGDLETATREKMRRMFLNMVRYEVTVGSAHRPDGQRWQPGDTVRLHAPGAMVFEPYDFIVRAVETSRSVSDVSSVLTLVLPDQAPEVLPWA